MKSKKRLFLSICSIVIIFAIIFVFSNSINASETLASQETDNADEIVAELESYIFKNEEMEKQEDKNDLLALSILRKYNITQEEKLITDWTVECNLMKKICTMLNDNMFNDDEAVVMRNYLERRYSTLIDMSYEHIEGQDELQIEIEKILGFDHWEN